MKPEQSAEEAEDNRQYEEWLASELHRGKQRDDQDWFGD